MHQKAADSILHVCLTNEGLYVKLGQGLNTMSHILPKEYTNTLKVLLDNAKPVPMPQIRRTIEEETGKSIEELFVAFDDVPVASASIAQVHKAWRKAPHDGLPPVPVAVKVRKPCIGRQSKWDIYVFQFFSWTVQHLFGLPTQWSRKTVVDGLKREMDFTIEAANAEQFRHNFKDDPQVHIPVIYKELSSERLLVMEWVEAVKLTEVERIQERFDEKAVLRKLFDSFGDMVFKHGFVHCDPHAANVLVRPMPESCASLAPPPPSKGRDEGAAAEAAVTRHRKSKGKKDFQVVLVDFGLCVPESERFRMLYSLLFKSLVTRDMKTLKKVVQDWGISDPEIFASIQMQKPLRSIQEGRYEEVSKEEVRQMQREAHSRLKSFMIDEAKIPRELPMVGRGVDILRGVNRLYGSPINRVNMFVQRAVQALGPLHDYEGVQRYLARVHKLTRETQANEGPGAEGIDLHSGATPVPVKNAQTRGVSGDEPPFESLFDDGALKLQKAQAAAMREIAAERDSSFSVRVTDKVESLYRAFLFHLVMTSFSVAHWWTRWYNQMLRLLFPVETVEQLMVSSFEDRLERMEGTARIN